MQSLMSSVVAQSAFISPFRDCLAFFGMGKVIANFINEILCCSIKNNLFSGHVIFLQIIRVLGYLHSPERRNFEVSGFYVWYPFLPPFPNIVAEVPHIKLN